MLAHFGPYDTVLNSLFGVWEFLVALFWYAIFFLLPVGILAIVVHLIFSIPLRRRERARFFLDLIEPALDCGLSVEHAIVSAAESRDRAMGIRFYMLAVYIEDALEKVPRFLLPQISAMLRAGERLGDLRRVLPACREILRDPPAAVQSATHYMVAVLLAFSPVAVFLITLETTFVIPRFQQVAEGMGVKLWPLTLFVFGHSFCAGRRRADLRRRPAVCPLVSISRAAICGLDRVENSVEAKTAAADVFGHALRVARWWCAGS